jgi:hypothetical protein
MQTKTEYRKDLAYRVENDVKTTIQPPLKDISYGFAQKLTDMMYSKSEEEKFPTRKEAVEYFDKRFMERELTRVKGNITQYVRDAHGAADDRQINNLRRNVYRQIEKHGLHELVDAARPWKQAQMSDDLDSKAYIAAEKIESTLSNALSGYRDVIQPNVYNNISESIKEKSGMLAEKISEYAPTPANRLRQVMQGTAGITSYREAKAVFEKQVVYDALEAAEWDKKKAAGYLGDSLRTLNRKITELSIEQKLQEKERPDSTQDVIRIEDHVRQDQGKDNDAERPVNAVSDVERLRQLIAQYNAKREAERVRKEKKEMIEDSEIKIAA